MFQVLDNGEPALMPSELVENSIFNDFQKAIKYAKWYLCDYAKNVKKYEPNTKYDYSGFGDYIEIREIAELNIKCKYWEFNYDSEEPEGSRQGLASIWSESWHPVKYVYGLTEEDLKSMLSEDIDFYNDTKYYENINSINESYSPVSARYINYAIKELKKLKDKYPLEDITA